MVQITLTAAVRNNLYNLQQTESAINRTNNRLNSGKKITSVEDDPVKFYRAKALHERSEKFGSLQDGINSSMSLIKASQQGVSTIEDMMKGIKANLENMLQASSKKEFNAYRSAIFKTAQQVMQVTSDSSYNGVSYIDNTLQYKEVELSNVKKRKLRIQGIDTRAAKLGLIEWNVGQATVLANYQFGSKHKKYAENEHKAGNVALYKNIVASINGDLSTNYDAVNAATKISLVVSQAKKMFGFIVMASQVERGTQAGVKDSKYTPKGSKEAYHNVTLHNLLGRVALVDFTAMIGDADSHAVRRANYMRKNINYAIEDANYGLSQLQVGSVKLATSLSILTVRKDFNDKYTNVLDQAADNIELIETSREIANYRASSARNKMGIAALNVASSQEANLADLIS